ncbi:Conserved_hypothetical protein [Hexamita inflata]|uniref:Uncharacterized protein n=1 Tax=Hexamita inflata TaxID=28002 RepID=A0AA86UR64_9EUKA|nr:Conserved hypothetical protein [Hexamita inflata]
MLILIKLTTQYQVFTISEFQFCYNYVFDSPFQESLNLNMTDPFTFDGASARANCTETQNVIFRQISYPVVSLQLNLNVNTQQSSFALFFYVFKNVEIQNSNITMKLQNGDNKNVSLLSHSSPEFTISLFAVAYNVQTDASSFKNIYGISRVLDQKLTLNQTSFTFSSSSTGIANFFGLCHQADQVQLENSSFNLNVISTIAAGLLYINTGFVQVYNLSMSGQLSGTNTFGMIFNAQAQVNFNMIMFSLKTLGATLNCGFVQTVTGSAIVTTSNINFVGFSFSPSEPVSYGAGSTCPCIQGAQLSQGLCNCSTGSSLVSGVCQCTAGATMVGNSCVCTAGATMVNGVCVCTSGASLVGNVCVCTVGSTLVGNACVCTAGASLQSGLCVCTAGATLTSGVCVCTTGATLQSGVCVCVANALLVGNACVCQPANSQLQSGVCVCTPAYSTMSGNTCVCTPTYTTMQSGVCKCTPTYSSLISGICTCTPTSSYMNNGVCSCPSDSIISASACVCQPGGSSMVGNVCTCFKGATLVSGNCQCTTAGSSRSGNSCVCNPNYYKDGWLPNGNAWCTNVNMCCTKCMAKLGSSNWVCSDWNYHSCSNSGTTVLS